MPRVKTERKLLFGKAAEHSNWGLLGCSHGMYARGGFDFYVYGIKGIFNYTVEKRWGDFI